MKKWAKKNWRIFIIEFLSVFTAVIAAFSLNNWKDNQRDKKAEEKILIEIRNGLKADLNDLIENKKGADLGIKACQFFRNIVYHDTIAQDSMLYNYFFLTSSISPVINKSGYEVLKSKGMEILQNDSLRTNIINMYEFEFNGAYSIDVTTKNTYDDIRERIDQLLNKSFYYEEGYQAPLLEPPLTLSSLEQSRFLTYLFRIEALRFTSLGLYRKLEEKINSLIDEIDKELESEFK